MNSKKEIDEKTIFEIQPDKITVHKDLPRHRKELGEIEKMMDSIKTFGQMQPIVINRDNELIAGGRRLAACLMLGIKARVCYKDTIDPLLMRELELEENLQRKALTPAEECLAVDELVKLKQAKLGKPTQGREGGFTLEDAAETIGKTKGNVIESLQIAEMIKDFPDLSKAKTKSEIKKAYKGLQRVSENIAALATFEKTIEKEDRFTLENANAFEHMKKQADNSIDLLFTDPPYGIDVDENGMTIGGQTGGELTSTGTTYQDDIEYATKILTELSKESYRFTKPNAHAYIFCGRDRFIFQLAYDLMIEAGWTVLKWPIVWVKMSSGQCNQPTMWPSSAYEAVLFARKTTSALALEGKPDWIQCDIVPSGKKVHQAEKPLPLLKELISRVATPGVKVYDPFTGSGAILEAACEMKLIPSGCELAVENYANALSRMTKWQGENK
ncbi:MAG: ParB/RepB/Spo0J family partition protein [Desulfobacterales bacterium]|nr:ParB/RepB/Spo0J family partition protein [Desulfobacterales bacterium]